MRLAAYKSGGATAARLQTERDKTSEEVELQADGETIDEATGGATAASGTAAAILQGGHDETGGDTELYADGGEVTGTAEKEDGENV